MQGRKSRFKEELAQSMRSASELRINFDNHIAQASMDASDMKAAYEQGALVASDDAADMRRTSIEVCMMRRLSDRFLHMTSSTLTPFNCKVGAAGYVQWVCFHFAPANRTMHPPGTCRLQGPIAPPLMRSHLIGHAAHPRRECIAMIASFVGFNCSGGRMCVVPS